MENTKKKIMAISKAKTSVNVDKKKRAKKKAIKDGSKAGHLLKLDVVELFAGVGGFRLGLERTPTGRKKKDPNYEVVWSN